MEKLKYKFWILWRRSCGKQLRRGLVSRAALKGPLTSSMLAQPGAEPRDRGRGHTIARERGRGIFRMPATAATVTLVVGKRPAAAPNQISQLIQQQIGSTPVTASTLRMLEQQLVSNEASSSGSTLTSKPRPSDAGGPQAMGAAARSPVRAPDRGHDASSSVRRKRLEPEGQTVPLGLRLRSQKVRQITLDKYMLRIKNAEHWFVKHRIKHDTDEDLDRALCLFFDYLSERSPREEPTVGAYSIYGYQLLKCNVPTHLYLPNAKQQLAGWRHSMPGGMSFGVAEEIADECCVTALENGAVEFALAAQLELDTYFRPTEVLTLRCGQITLPTADSGASYQKWVATLAPSEERGRTETGLTMHVS